MPTYLLTLRFDGTDFSGWQSQPNTRTVQDVLETALAELFEQGIRTAAAGRTDAGVHAECLPVSFTSGVVRDAGTVVRALNQKLPNDLAVMTARVVPDGFSARYDAVSRSYRYQIAVGAVRDPLVRRTHWQLPVDLSADAMDNALAALVGEHDFSSFRGADCAAKTPVKTMVHAARRDLGAGRTALDFEAGGFLRGMVRSIVGTLVEIGRGERPASDMAELLARPDRAGAGRTAPAHGLFFARANYSEWNVCDGH
ncbi:MAG: tRNA pseudouridine(38-40) synthase TruA [Deltaproteobacteria bacterium]|nr:tRNA pseudouridine(38-40) synthase TruA [Deltaproteobacteria bacterium]